MYVFISQRFLARLSDKMSPKSIPTSTNHQMRSEILAKLVAPHGVGAEIGVHKGEFIKPILDRVIPEQLHLIDPWYLFGEEWPWANGDKSTVSALCNILQVFATELVTGSVVLHIGYDLEVLPNFPNKFFDWVYLDTSHRYDHTRAELHVLKHKVKRNGVIVGDDWHEDPNHLHHGVFQAVNEFVAQEGFELFYASDLDKQWAIKRNVM